MSDRAPRFASKLQIKVCFDGAETTAKILDVSEQGMKLFIKSAPPVGSVVGLRARDLLLQAQVRWTRRGHCGVLLERVLSDTQLAVLSGGSSTRRPAKAPSAFRRSHDGHPSRSVFHDRRHGDVRT